jgi:hypothetical protein
MDYNCVKCGEPVGEWDTNAVERPEGSDQWYHAFCAKQQDIEDKEHQQIGEALEFIAAREDFFSFDHGTDGWHVRWYGGGKHHHIGPVGSFREACELMKLAVRDLPPIAPPDPFVESKEGAEVGSPKREDRPYADPSTYTLEPFPEVTK